jgi:uncharacterized protein YjdB
MRKAGRTLLALVLSLVLVLPVMSVQAEATYQTVTMSGTPVVMSDDESVTEDVSVETFDDEMEPQTASSTLTEKSVYDAIVAQKSRYPEGMTWTNANPTGGYLFKGYLHYYVNMYGYGCAAFAYEMSDIAFGNLPAVDHHNWSNVRVGDILRINNNTHSVIVLKVNGDVATVAEGNYNSSIHWGRQINLSNYSSSNLNYITTRWTTETNTDSSDTVDVSKLEKVSSSVYATYRTHVQSYGWESTWRKNGQTSGTVGKSKRLEAINIKVKGDSKLGIQYTTHCQSYGWLPWSSNGEMSGTEGESKRLEAIKIQLTGADKDKYDVYYRVHAQSYGWLGWTKNGAAAGTAGYGKRLEGIQIVIVKKGEYFNRALGGYTSAYSASYIAKSGTSSTVKGASTTNVVYRTHVQTYGWQGWRYNGATSGTSGESKRLEAINIKLTNAQYSGGISYRTHIQSYGWEKTWRTNGALSGTSGQSKRLEAIQIKLTGEMAKHYDVYYRVHAQSYGWLGWAKNGASAGTSGLSKRLEGIQIVLVKKGGKAPSRSYNGIASKTTKSFVK